MSPDATRATASGSPSGAPDALLRRALAVVAWLRDPALPGLLLMALLMALGFVAFYLGWRGSARTIYVALQIPHVVSAGIAGVALVALGAALFNVQMSRRDAAREEKLTDDVLDEIAALVALAPVIRARAIEKRAGS
jgi:hypothetical protein